MIIRIIDYLRDRMKTVVGTFFFLLAAIVVFDQLIDKSHAHTMMELLPAFWSVFGFGACMLIVGVAKILGSIVRAREDFYE